VVMVLVQVEVAPDEASFDAQKARLGLADADVDPHFGLRRIDPARGIYAMKVSNRLAARLARTPGVSGPFANPRIVPAVPEGLGRSRKAASLRCAAKARGS
jgi:hypothetical protein